MQDEISEISDRMLDRAAAIAKAKGDKRASKFTDAAEKKREAYHRAYRRGEVDAERHLEAYDPDGEVMNERDYSTGLGSYSGQQRITTGVPAAKAGKPMPTGKPKPTKPKPPGASGRYVKPKPGTILQSYDPAAEFADRVMNSLHEYDPNRGAPGRATPQTHLAAKKAGHSPEEIKHYGGVETSSTTDSARRSAMKRRERETKKYGEAGARARESVRTARRPGVSRAGQRFTDRELEGETGRLVDRSTGDLTRKIGSRGSGAGGYTRSPNVRSRHYAKRKLEPKVDHSDMQDSYDPTLEFADNVMREAFDKMSPEELAHYDATANKPGSQLGHRRDATKAEREKMAARFRAERRGPGPGTLSVRMQKLADLRKP